MKPTCSLLLFLFAVVSVTAQSYEPVRSGNLYGYSGNGRMIIPATFQYATHFREGLALVKQNGKWGYIDSTGAWIVPPKFDQAEPFSGKSAFVYMKGKTGVIDTTGKYLAEPVYDSLEVTHYGIVITRNGLKGLISDKYGTTPVEYRDFDSNYATDYLYAERGKNDYDLYLNGKLLLRNLDHGLRYGDYEPTFGLLQVSVRGRKGLLNQNGEWIVSPKYDRIDFITVKGEDTWKPEHDTKGNGQLIRLEEWITPDDYDPVPVYYLARMDGTLISDLPFERAELISHEYWEELPDELDLRQDGKIAYLKPDMTIERSLYVSVVEYLGWKICDDGAKTHMFDRNEHEVLTYDEIVVPAEGQYNYDAPYIYAPYVHVAEQKGDVLYWAIYHLVERRFITEWMPEEIGVTIVDIQAQQQLFSFYTAEKQRYSWYYDGTGIIMPFEYTTFTPYNYQLFSATKEGSGDMDLYVVKPYSIPKKLLSAPMIGSSSELMTTTCVVDEEGNVITYDFPFTHWFLYYRDDAGKYGLVTDDQTVIPAQYDSLASGPGSLDFVLAVKKNGKWGSVDIRNGDRFEPFLNEPIAFGSEWPDLVITALPEEGYYLAINGKKLWSLNNEYYIFKEGGKVGLESYRDFDDSDEPGIVIPAMYKAIAQNIDEGRPDRFRAKGTNGKYGVIDVFNDTIIPFIYTAIENDYENEVTYDGLPAHYYVTTTIGKKKGIADITTGAQLPAQFESHKILRNSYDSQFGFRTAASGKYGLYSLELEEILPCTYDAIAISNFHGDYNEVYLQQNGKWQVVNTQSAYELLPRRLERLKQYDLIVDSSGYIKTASGYDRYEVFSGELLASGMAQPDLSAWPSDYKLFLKDGLIGVADAEGKVIQKPQFTFVTWMDESTIATITDGELYFYLPSLNKRYTTDQW